uniref:Uncharacterized protein MANES_16G099800 n=1 Tax=Rhizophora mucronata TaxID=61149 RepID=A0A2P2K5J8_RHIMU
MDSRELSSLVSGLFSESGSAFPLGDPGAKLLLLSPIFRKQLQHPIPPPRRTTYK